MITSPAIPALCRKTVTELCALLKNGEVTSTEIISAYLQSIALQNEKLNAYLEVYPVEALAQAAASDARRRAGAPRSLLDGIPIAMKDNIMVQGHLCTCASRMLADFISPYDATVTVKLKEAGLPFLGRLNLDEFAMGSSSETFASTRNPVDPAMAAGGSSGGAAAAVAAGMAPFALGSDTGGSIRRPASFCGVLGVKPAYGTVSRYGLVAFASSFDQIGPLAKTAQDAALLMNIIAGHDPRDATSHASLSADFLGQLSKAPPSLRGLCFGMPSEFFEEEFGVQRSLSEPVRKAILQAAQRFREMGAEVQNISLPSLRYALSSYFVLSSAEASSNLARFDGMRYGYRASDCADLDTLYRKTRQEGFGAEVKQRIAFGTHVLSGGPLVQLYEKARHAKTLLLRETLPALAHCDALLMPVAPTAAYPLGERSANPSALYADDLYTVPANLTGLPALSLPCGQTDSGLPIGMGLMGAMDSLPRLLAIASAYEHANPTNEGDKTL